MNSIQDQLETRLFRAVCLNDLEKATLLIQDPRLTPIKLNSSFAEAVLGGYHKVVAIMLQDKRTDPSACDNRAIRIASQLGHHRVFALLLQDARVDPNSLHEIWSKLSIKHFSEETLMVLSARLVFPKNIYSTLSSWSLNIDKYRKKLFAIAEDLTVVLDATLDNNGLQVIIWEMVYEYMEHILLEGVYFPASE